MFVLFCASSFAVYHPCLFGFTEGCVLSVRAVCADCYLFTDGIDSSIQNPYGFVKSSHALSRIVKPFCCRQHGVELIARIKVIVAQSAAQEAAGNKTLRLGGTAHHSSTTWSNEEAWPAVPLTSAF